MAAVPRSPIPPAAEPEESSHGQGLVRDCDVLFAPTTAPRHSPMDRGGGSDTGRKSWSLWRCCQPLPIVCWRRIKPVTSRRTVTSSGLADCFAQGDHHPRIAAALLAVVRRIEPDGRKRALLVETGPHLLTVEVKQAWSLALGINEPDNREEALAALIASLPRGEYASAIAEILERPMAGLVARRFAVSATRGSCAKPITQDPMKRQVMLG